MNRKHYFYPTIALGLLLMATSCVDDKYDLSDIDTTTSIKLNELTVPVRLNTIMLDDVLDVEDSEVLNVYQNSDGSRYYAIHKKGGFSADPIFIEMLRTTGAATVPAIELPGGNVNNKTVTFSYLINNVDPSLDYLSYFGLWDQQYMEIKLSVSPANVGMTDVVVTIPEKFTAIYKGQEYSDGKVPVTVSNGEMEQPIYVTSMLFSPALRPDNQSSLDVTGEIGIASASLSGAATVNFYMSPFTANVVSGSLDHAVDSPAIAPVDLTDLPGFLKDGESNLVLQNPQLYMNFIYLNGAYYNTQLSIMPEGIDTHPINNLPIRFNQTIVLAPDTQDLDLDYSGATLQQVEDLKYILSGAGLPHSIGFSLDNTRVIGEVANLILGEDKEISGSYEFFSPLAFGEGAQIIYQKKEEDFFGGDMEYVNVELFRIQSDVKSELPLDVTLTLYPLDRDGNRIKGKNGQTVYASSTVVPGNSKLDLKIEEPFEGLDGLEYVVATNNMNGVSLSPDQTLTLDNIKATVTGQYVTKL
ncbi:MAG: hypothetical protein J1F43_04170 [Muribaculaceae bacterium]|nr:hypothetical protein [Muribaculaceae bacterium]